MERIAFEMNLDPVDFRMRNLLKKGDRLIKAYGMLAEENPIPKMVHQLKKSANYEERKKNVDAFNQVGKRLCYIISYYSGVKKYAKQSKQLMSIY